MYYVKQFFVFIYFVVISIQISKQATLSSCALTRQEEPIKWGILSAGKISNDFVAIVKNIPQHQFVSVAARSLASAEKFAKKHNISKAYGSYEELAKDPDVQVVYIGNINPQHLANARLMLENGKHLLIEKPMAMNAREATEMLALAKSKKLFVMEALVLRFTPSYQFALKQIRDGIIGKVYHVSAGLGYKMADSERIKKKSLGGGTVLDLGIYAITVADQVFNDESPGKVTAIGHLNKDGVDLTFAANLEYSGDKTASIFGNSLVELSNEAFIIGTNGTIRITANFKSSQKVFVNNVPHEFRFPATNETLNYGDSLALRYEAEEVRNCINAGKLESDVMPHKDIIAMARISDEIRKQIGVIYDVDKIL